MRLFFIIMFSITLGAVDDSVITGSAKFSGDPVRPLTHLSAEPSPVPTTGEGEVEVPWASPEPVGKHSPLRSHSRQVRSTAYCLRGTMANGKQVHDGAVASTILKRGSWWRITSGPLEGKVLQVEDTGGPKALFDIWMASCEAATQYGVRHITIEPWQP